MPKFDELRAEAAQLLSSTTNLPQSLSSLLKLVNAMQREHDREIERMTDECEELDDRKRELTTENGQLKKSVASLERRLEGLRFVHTIDGQRIIARAYKADPAQTAIELNYLRLGHIAGQLSVDQGIADERQLTLAKVG